MDQSTNTKAIERPSHAAPPPTAPAGIEPQPNSARRSFCDDDHYAVVDIDTRNKGGASLHRMMVVEDLDFPTTAATSQPTASGHCYLFFTLPLDVFVRAGGIVLAAGVTLTSAPGSKLVGRRRYAAGNGQPVAAAPPWVLDRIRDDTPPPTHTTDTTAPAAPVAAPAPRINSNRTDDIMRARDASNSDARVQAGTKSADILPFSAPPVPNTKLALAFLNDVLDRNGRHDLFAIHPTLPKGAAGQVEAATFLPNDHDDLSGWIEQQQGKRNVYVSINRGRGEDSVDSRLCEANIGVVRAICVDVDPKKVAGGDASGQRFREERDRLMMLAKQLRGDTDCPPSLIVDSGGGIQAWWMLAPHVTVTPETVALAEGIGRTLSVRFGGDSTFDLARIMRLPGTINIPNAGKAAQGRTPALATILTAESSEKTYTLDQLAGWAPPTPEKTATKDRTASTIDMDVVEIGIPYEDLLEELRAKFDAFCVARPVVGALWRGEPAPWQSDESPSGFVFALATALRPAGIFTLTEFAQLVAVWERRSETHADDFERYVSRASNRSPAPLGGEGLEAREIDESKAPSKLKAAKQEASKAEAAKSSAPLGGMATPLRRFDPATLPPVPWVVRGLAARRAISTLTGPGGMSKSTWTLILAVAAASGRSDISGYPMTKQECVWVWSQEDDIDQMELRVAAIMQAFGVSHDDMLDANGKHMLYLNSGLGKGKRLNLAKRAGERIIDGEHLADLMASAQAIGASLVILDPLITLHQAPENDNVQMRAVFDLIGQIAVEANCAVLIVSHTGKPDKASSKGFAGDAYASRGASAQPDAGRANVTFMGMSEADTKAWRIPESTSHLDYVRIDDAKFNIGPKRREPRWFKREAVVVRGFAGDSMEVLRPVELEPSVSAGRPDLLEAIAKAMADHLPPATPHATAAVAAHLPAGMAAAIKGQNRARTINEAFGGEGVDEYMTNSGTLRRSKGSGNKGTMFTLLPADASLLTPQMLL